MTRIVDGLTLLGRNLFGAEQSAGQLLAQMDRAGIDVAVVAPARPPDYHLGPANDDVLAAGRAHRDRLVPLARLDPNRDDAGEAAHRFLGGGARGIFLHPREEVFAINDPRVDVVARTCAEHQVPLLVAAGFPWVSEPLQVAELAGRHPSVPIVMTNGGQLNISGLGQQDAFLALQAQQNLLIATSGVYRQDFIEATVAEFGASRVLFASCSPLFDPSYEVLRGRLSDLSRSQQQQIMHDTAARLFKI